MDKETFKEAAKIVESIDNAYVSIITKKYMIEIMMSFDENGNLDNWDDDNYWYLYADDKLYTNEEITRTIAKKADYIELSDGYGWTIYIGRNFTAARLKDAFNDSIGWLIDCKVEFAEMPLDAAEALANLGIEIDLDAVREAQEATEQEATEQADEQEADEQADEQAEQADEQEATEQADEQADEQEATEQAAEQAEQAAPKHHTIYSECTPCYTPCFAYDISHARTAEEQAALIERAEQADAPAAECVEEESWFCGTATAPIDADAAVQDADVASLTRTAEDNLYNERAAEQAAQKAKHSPITSFIITIFMIITISLGGAVCAHALTTTALALNADATATGEITMATRIDKKQTTPKPTTPATAATPATQAPATPTTTPTTPTTTPKPTTPATATAPATQAPAETPKAPTLAQLLARALEAQKTAQTAPQTPKEAQTTKETLSLKTALKRALMAPKTGTTECVIYSTLYAAIRIEEVTTPAPAPAETPKDATAEEADQESKSVWTIQADAKRIAFMRELRNVTRGRAYNEQITALLDAIDATDEDYMWKTAAFTALPDDLKKAIKEQFGSDACTDAERQECTDALDPHAERVTLHTAAIETAAEALARTAPEWSPMLFEETPAPATLRQAILELQYCIFPIDSSPRARVFRGLEGIDFKTLSTPEDYRAACKAASLRAGEPSTAIPPEARARIMQWRSGTVTTSATAVTSTAARLAAVWGMD